MAWWGKVVGGTFGFIVGGPLGAMLGASLGHSIDKGLNTGTGGADQERFLPGDQERIQAAFFTATFSVMGYISKADGRVTPDEISLAKDVMSHMQLDSAQKKSAIDLFNQGKKPDFNLPLVLVQLRKECHRRTTLLQMFLELQVQAAFADGRLDPNENSVLKEIAQSLGFRESDLQMIIEMIRGSGQASPTSSASELDPYKVLGVTEKTPMNDIKKAYRRLLSQHHPDKLVSKGLPEEMIKLANEKTHEIRTAWKKIQEIHRQA